MTNNGNISLADANGYLLVFNGIVYSFFFTISKL